jgi:hypothetical protein
MGKTITRVCLLLFVLALLPATSVWRANLGMEPPAPSQGTVYYVAPDGDDGNPGTFDYPWQTIQHAADTLVAGDTVYIRAGTYPEQVVPQHSGSADQYITYAAYLGEQVTIDGAGITLPDTLIGLFDISNKSYIRVSGLRIVNAGPYLNNAGILVNDSSYIIVDLNSTYNTLSSGIGVWGSDHVTVDSNKIEHACTDIGQECLTIAETESFEVKDNEVFDCQEEGIIVKDNSAYGQVYRNSIHHVGSTGLYVDSWNRYTHDIAVFQNTVHDIGDNGLAVGSEDGGTLTNVHIYNNLSYNNRWVGLSISANGLSGPMQDISVVNNTFYNNGWTDYGGGIVIENPNAQNVVLRNNLVSQNLSFQIAIYSTVPTQTFAIDHNLIDGFRGAEGEVYGDDYVEGDPCFVDPVGADFHLQGDSPAIDQGSSLDAPDDDYDGQSRPAGSGYDIGADEYAVFTHRVYLPVVCKD